MYQQIILYHHILVTGEWLIVNFPIAILSKFRFYSRPSYSSRSPALWKCHGSNDGITFTEITQAAQATA
jgi:hypothetical protein